MKKAIILLVLFISLSSIFAIDFRTSLMANNVDILKAKEEVSKALLDVKDAKAGFGPTIDLTITGSYIANPIDAIRINLGDYVNNASSDYITLYNGQENMHYQFSLQLTQPIFTWGKLSNAEKLYNAIYEARKIQLSDTIDKAETELLTRIATLYYLSEIQKVLSSQIEISQRLVDLSQEASKNGLMLAVDALEIQVKARELKLAYSQIDGQILLMLETIRKLTGLYDLEVSDIVFDENLFSEKLENLLGSNYQNVLSKSLSENRNTFSLLNKMAQIAELTKNIANASVNWKPDFALVMNADYSGSRFPLVETDWGKQDDWALTVTLAIKSTVYDGGKALRNVKRASSDVSQTEIDIQDAKSKISLAVSEAWSNLFVYQDQIDYQNALLDVQNEKNLISKRLLDTGYGSESDYLQGVLYSKSCETQILQTKINLASQLYNLMYLQGEIAQ